MILHKETVLIESSQFRKRTGKKVLLKLENQQPTGSFKIRGIGHYCTELASSGVSRFISSSGGNAGYAVAYAGKALRINVTVAVPETTPQFVRDRIRECGADVEIHGSVWDETDEYAKKLARDLDGTYISPFDHPSIWNGHATIIEELVQQAEKPDAMILSVGGGGLLCGVIEGLQRNGWSDVPVITVETEGTASFAASVSAGTLVTLDRIDSIASTLGAKQVTRKALEYYNTLDITSHIVSDRDTVEACLAFLNDHNVLVEPACGAALSVVYSNSDVIRDAQTVMVIVCGGIGVTQEKLREWDASLPS